MSDLNNLLNRGPTSIIGGTRSIFMNYEMPQKFGFLRQTGIKKFLIRAAVVLIVLLTFLLWLGFQVKAEIRTDKKEYSQGEVLKIKIKNYLSQSICFSSCEPYLMEKKEGREWKHYNYQECSEPNLAGKCIGSEETKAFELDLNFVETGFHRILLPVCLGCAVGQEFKESRKFYSNEFLIK